MWIGGILMIFPFIFMIVVSFRPSGLAYKPLFYSFTPILKNHQQVLENPNFLNWYSNTIITVTVTIISRMLVTIPAGYAFSKLRFKGKRILLALLLTTLMIPSEITMISKYLYFKKLGLLDSLWAIILPEISQVFHLFLFNEFFSSIPDELIEAAHIDGAKESTIMIKVFIPLSGPCIATSILFSFIHVWNNYIDPFLYISSINKQLITPALQFFQERGGVNIPVQLAGASIAILPIIVVFLFTQKFFISGISSSGIKG